MYDYHMTEAELFDALRELAQERGGRYARFLKRLERLESENISYYENVVWDLCTYVPSAKTIITACLEGEDE